MGFCLLLCTTAWAGTWRDDFEDGDLEGWLEADFGGNATIREKDGKLVIRDIDRSTAVLAFFNERQTIKDFTLTVDATMTQADAGNTYLWITFRYTDATFAFLTYEADNNPNGLSIFRANPFQWNIGFRPIPFAFTIGQWHRFRIEMTGSQVTLWIDDERIGDADWQNQALLPERGAIGLGGGGGELQFDNFAVTSDDIEGSDGENFDVFPKDKLATTWGGLKAL